MTGNWRSPACLACGATNFEPVIDLGAVPALIGANWQDAQHARAATRGQLDLALCSGCGHVANQSFDPKMLDYDGTYDNSLHHSAVFRNYADVLAKRLVTTYGVRGRQIVEIGSGKGDFLKVLCRLGDNSGVGYDPTAESGSPQPGVRLVSEYYRPGSDLEPYDLLICRHVLEHLADPAAFLVSIRQAAPGGAVLYLEVPAAEFTFSPEDSWDCIYEHVSYFSADSLRSLVQRCGFTVLDGGRSFAGQFLWLDLKPGTSADAPVPADPAHLERVRLFGQHWHSVVQSWRDQLTERRRRGEAVVLWGAGAKGVAFLNAVDPKGKLAVVDVNPRKQDSYVPGTGHHVISPQELAGLRVTRVLITNPIYLGEISEQLRDLGIEAEVLTV